MGWIRYPLVVSADTAIYPHLASQYHAWPSAARCIAMLRVDKFPYPRKQTRVTNSIHAVIQWRFSQATAEVRAWMTDYIKFKPWISFLIYDLNYALLVKGDPSFREHLSDCVYCDRFLQALINFDPSMNK